jgi:hypothetical protein
MEERIYAQSKDDCYMQRVEDELFVVRVSFGRGSKG